MQPAGGTTTPAARRREDLVAAGALVVIAAGGALAVGLAAIPATQPVENGVRSPASTAALFVAIELAFAISGAVLVRRRVAPTIGWLFLAVAAVDGLNRVGEYWSAAAVVARPGSLPGGYGMAWLDGATEHAMPLLLAVVVLLFPTGRPPSPAWRWPVWALGAGAALAGLARALQPGDLDGVPFPAANPFGWTAADDHLDVVQTAGAVLVAAGVVGCLVSVAPRWMRAGDRERCQLEGLALLALIVAIAVPIVPLLPDPFTVLYAVATASIPIVLGLAILGVRLEAIDRLFRTAVAVFLVVAAIVVVYVLVVGGLGALLGHTADPWLALVAFVTIVVLIRPARRAANSLAERLIRGPRAKPSEVLADFAVEAAASSSDGLLDRLAEVVADGSAARAAEVWVRQGDVLVRAGRWPPGSQDERAGEEPAPIEARLPLTFATPTRARPIERDDLLLGALTVVPARGSRWHARDDQLLDELAAAAGLLLENEQLVAELRDSRQRIVTAQDAERRRLERDLHDGAQQRLLALAIDVRRRRAQLGGLGAEQVAQLLDRTAAELQAAVEELRDLARGLHPAILTASGLEAALRSMADRAPLPVTVEAPVGRLPATVESIAYFVACEALTNAIRHGQPTSVVITGKVANGALRLEVSDDGCGGAAAAAEGGLTGLADRVAAIGGTLSVSSPAQEGTTVRAELPCGSS